MKKLKNNLVKLTPSSRLYQIPVPIIGLTGGIGTGKSTVADLFHKNKIPVIDADKLVKSIYQQTEALDFIRSQFPEAIEENQINFKKLRAIAFRDPLAKKSIEDFIYIRLPGEFKRAFLQLNSPQLVVYDVPLLFEKGLDSLIDLSICVYAPKHIQIDRIIKRDHCSREIALKIIDQQMSIGEKRKLASFTIENIGTIEFLKKGLQDLLDKILEPSA